jgi:sporulation protein YlmC with PRC-barrel domain
MKTTTLGVALCATLGAFLNSGSLALATADDDIKSTQPAPAAQKDAATTDQIPSISTSSTDLARPMMAGSVFKQSELIGMKVENASHQKLGQIKDVIVDLRAGRIPFVVLASGGFFGVGDKQYAIPTSLLSRGSDAKVLVASIDTAKMKDAPVFDSRAALDQSWGAEVFRFYGLEPYWKTSVSGTAETTTTTEIAEPAGAAVTTSYESYAGEDPDTYADRILRLYQRGRGDAERVDRALRNGDIELVESVGLIRHTVTEPAGIEIHSTTTATTHNESNAASAAGSATLCFVSGHDLTGFEIKNAGDERIGEIKDLVIDLPSGNIAYVVLAAGGFLGLGERSFALPPSLFVDSSAARTLVLNIDKEKLRTAPAFELSDWSHVSSPTYITEVYQFYGVPPTFRASAAPEIREPAGAAPDRDTPQNPDSNKQQKQQRDYDSKSSDQDLKSGSKLEDPAGAERPADRPQNSTDSLKKSQQNSGSELRDKNAQDAEQKYQSDKSSAQPNADGDKLLDGKAVTDRDLSDKANSNAADQKATKQNQEAQPQDHPDNSALGEEQETK